MVPAYRIDLAYNGSAFEGWQSQPSGKTVQDTIEKALAVILRESVRVVGSSRTDTGVHAEHQVAVFKTSQPPELHRWLQSLNGLLPTTIRIYQIASVPEEFHPILSSTGKAYRYRIWNDRCENPFVAPFAWQIWHPLALEPMREAAKLIVGEHDFTSLCAADSSAKQKVRRVVALEVEQCGPLINIWITGEGFLKQMVRNIAGVLVEVGGGKLAVTDVERILAAKDRRAAPKTAPAAGLALLKVFYGPIARIPDLQRAASSGYSLATSMMEKI